MRNASANPVMTWSLCALISLSLHAAVLRLAPLWQPPQIHFEHGISSLQLTLMPMPAVPETVTETVEAPPPATQPLPVLPEETEISEHPDPIPDREPEIETPDPEPDREPEIEAPAPQPEPPPEAPTPPEAPADEIPKGVDEPPQQQTVIRPIYPQLSRRLGETGDVSLQFMVTTAGRAENIRILRGSGFRRLDEAAVSAVRRARFTPARRLGQPAEAEMSIVFRFRLEDAGQIP